MKSVLLALALLTSVERTPDGNQVRLIFDAPVTFSQSMAATPPRIIIRVPQAGVTPGLSAGPGLTLTPAEDASSLDVTVDLTLGSSGSVSSTGSGIIVDLTPGIQLLAAHPVPDAQQAMGGIADPLVLTDASIGPEDLLEINVFELPELKTTTRVLGDGTVSLPLLGVVQAAGLTKTGFEARLRDMLESRYLTDPQVTVTITEFKSKQVSVIGAVTKPGTFEMIGPRTVLQVISEAGGLTKEAGADIFILRKAVSGQVERIHLDLDELIIKGNPALNLPLLPQDVINIPVDRPIYVFVDGAVKNPGQVEGKSSRPITLLQAVSRAGGLTERANMRGVHVLRKAADGTQSRIPVNLRDIRKGKSDDIMLEDGDVVVVPETFF